MENTTSRPGNRRREKAKALSIVVKVVQTTGRYHNNQRIGKIFEKWSHRKCCNKVIKRKMFRQKLRWVLRYLIVCFKCTEKHPKKGKKPS